MTLSLVRQGGRWGVLRREEGRGGGQYEAVTLFDVSAYCTLEVVV